MPVKKPSPRGQQLLDLRLQNPAITAKEIAKSMNTTVGTVYTLEAKLRNDGLMPKVRGRRHRGKGKTPTPRSVTPVPVAPPAPREREVLPEMALNVELEANRKRTEQVEKSLVELADEKEQLVTRAARLTRAIEQLSGTPNTTIAAPAPQEHDEAVAA